MEVAEDIYKYYVAPSKNKQSRTGTKRSSGENPRGGEATWSEGSTKGRAGKCKIIFADWQTCNKHGNRNSSEECKALQEYGLKYKSSCTLDTTKCMKTAANVEEFNVMVKNIVSAILKRGGGKYKSKRATVEDYRLDSVENIYGLITWSMWETSLSESYQYERPIKLFWLHKNSECMFINCYQSNKPTKTKNSH